LKKVYKEETIITLQATLVRMS